MNAVLRYGWLLLLLVCVQGMAQKVEHVVLDKRTKTFLEEQAISRVKQFQDYCAVIANKNETKAKRQLVITQALDLFMDDKRTIQITNFDGTIQPPKRISNYLSRLMMLNYNYVNITSFDFFLATEVMPSAVMRENNPGEEWYEGIVSVRQRFEGGRFEYTNVDEVERLFTVYMLKTQFYQGDQLVTSWVVKIGDIQGRSITQDVIRNR